MLLLLQIAEGVHRGSVAEDALLAHRLAQRRIEPLVSTLASVDDLLADVGDIALQLLNTDRGRATTILGN